MDGQEMTEAKLSPKSLRSRWLVHRRLQIHFALSCSFLMLLAAMSVWVAMNYAQSAYMHSWAFTKDGSEFMFKANSVVMALIFADVLAVFLLSIYFSHYVAGPLYNIQRSIRKMIDTGESKKIMLRKHDLLHDLAELINELVRTRPKT